MLPNNRQSHAARIMAFIGVIMAKTRNYRQAPINTGTDGILGSDFILGLLIECAIATNGRSRKFFSLL
jgi:hypothetical protein